MQEPRSAWPVLDYAAWRETGATLHRWTQVVGKVRLALTPWLNHGWHVPLYVSARGLGTSAIHVGGEVLEIDFDFVDHRLVLRTSNGPRARLRARCRCRSPTSIAASWPSSRRRASRSRSIPRRTKCRTPIPFADDDRARRLRPRGGARVLARAGRRSTACSRLFRTSFLGKASPVHFFWGSFDLAVTRFSGRAAPPHPGGIPAPARRGHARGVFARGQQRRLLARQRRFPAGRLLFVRLPVAAGLRRGAASSPRARAGRKEMGEWLLPYEASAPPPIPTRPRCASSRSTYRAAADLARWDPALDCALGVARRPRPVD